MLTPTHADTDSRDDDHAISTNVQKTFEYESLKSMIEAHPFIDLFLFTVPSPCTLRPSCYCFNTYIDLVIPFKRCHRHPRSPLSLVALYSNKISSSSSIRSNLHHGSSQVPHGAVAGQPVFSPPHGALQIGHDAPYWSGAGRFELYDIPVDTDDATWSRIHRVQDSGNRVRVLKSSNISGYILYHQEPNGGTRVGDWRYIHELLMLNPINYFLAHPQIDSIWVELLDTDVYTASSGGTDPSGMVTVGDASTDGSGRSLGSRSRGSVSTSTEDLVPNYALAIHRSEYTYSIALAIRQMQADFFSDNRIGFPHARSFTNTLHGR